MAVAGIGGCRPARLTCNNGDLHAANGLNAAVRCSARQERGSRNARPAPEFHTIETIRDFSRDMQHLCNRDAAKYHK